MSVSIGDRLQNLVQSIRNLEPFSSLGLGIVTLCLILVGIAASFPAGSDAPRRLGAWQPPCSPDVALQSVLVQYDASSGKLSLEQDPASQEQELSQEVRSFIAAHVRKFNEATKGRSFNQAGTVRGPGDCLFQVALEKGAKGKLATRLQAADVAAYDIYPTGQRTLKDLGPIHFAPDEIVHPYFSDGSLGFFLDPKGRGDLASITVGLMGEGVYNAASVLLDDERGNARAEIHAAADGSAVEIKPLNELAVFLENNPPLAGEGIRVENGQVVEIGGRFFESHVSDASTMAITRQKGGSIKRVYPMGRLFHIVGPLSLDGSHQSLGIEYLFQEYLMGLPDQDIPPGELWLTLDERLQAQLATSIDGLSLHSRRGVASALIMDAQTGAIVAMAGSPRGYDPEDHGQVMDLLSRGREPFYNHGCFKRHVIGSVTKAFHSFLALQVMGNQARSIVVETNAPNTATLFGHHLYGPASKTLAIDRSVIDFDQYLIHSDNGYQHSLGLLLLAGVTDPLSQVPSPWLSRDSQGRPHLRPLFYVEREPLAYGGLGPSPDRLVVDPTAAFSLQLQKIFDISTSSGDGVLNDRDLGVYSDELLDLGSHLLAIRLPSLEKPMDVLKARSVVCAPETARMELQEIKTTKDASNVLFGANRNRWTDVKMCEAFSRMMTGKRVKARLVQQFRDSFSGELVDLELKAVNETPVLDVPNPSAFAQMRQILEKVPQEGTATKLKPMIASLASKNPGFKLVGKTGTIDDGLKDDPDSRLFLGTFGLTDEQGFTKAYTFVVYLKTALTPEAHFDFINEQLPQWWSLLQLRQPPKPPVPAETPNQVMPKAGTANTSTPAQP